MNTVHVWPLSGQVYRCGPLSGTSRETRGVGFQTGVFYCTRPSPKARKGLSAPTHRASRDAGKIQRDMAA